MSEFGSGLVICLVKFTEHFERDMGDEKKIKEIMGESGVIEMWANGASDHLYEIKVPEGTKWDTIRKLVEELKSTGLEMGHGFHGTEWTKEDVLRLQALTRQVALEIDKVLGLECDMGEW